MSYDPFARGPHPVGVRSATVDSAGRSVPVEIWYPTRDSNVGKDLDPATQDTYVLGPGLPAAPQAALRDGLPSVEATSGTAPTIVFSHGFGGHRRQTTHLTTHLASHGYVVAAPDHMGNTATEVMGWMLGVGAPADMAAYTRETATNRVADATRTLDGLLSGEFGVTGATASCGITGHSFGGWTTLATTAADPRIRAALPLAPAGGDGGVLAGPDDPRIAMRDMLELDWDRPVDVLTLVADGDTVLPYPMMADLLARATGIDRLVVLANADHYHFCDNVEAVHDLMSMTMGEGAKPSSELVPGDHAYAMTTALGLAHFDASLRGSPPAAAFLAQDLRAVLAERGVDITVVTRN
ncbi:MAG: alpha/beta hydrolase [Acidimicrobiales bacterium]|nr:alpha/beta hydrolase [Acidimicrobiales bacterium]